MALFQPNRGSAVRTAVGPPPRGSASGYEAVRASRDFWTLRRRFGSFVVPACVLFASTFAIAASANLPSILYSLYWPRFTARGALWSIYGGLISSVGLIGTVTDSRPADSARFTRMQVRALTGAGAERGGRS